MLGLILKLQVLSPQFPCYISVMISIFLTLTLFPLLFGFGYLLRRTHLANVNHAQFLLKVVIHVIMPALIIGSITQLNITKEILILPIVAGLIVVFAWPCAWFVAKTQKLTNKTLATFIIGSMIMNLAIIYPFVSLFLNREAVALLALFDFGHALLVLTLVYGIACYYGRNDFSLLTISKKIAVFPPNIAMLLALFLNWSDFTVNPFILDFIYNLGRWGILIVLISLGILFRFDPRCSSIVLLNIITRCLAGLSIGMACIGLFHIVGLMKLIVIVAAIAPIGFNTLVFSTKEGLDQEYAANIVSISMLSAFIYIPIVLIFSR